MNVWLLTLVLSMAPFTGHARTQVNQPAALAPEPIAVDPTTAWRDIASAYQRKPTAERMAITAQVGDRPIRRAELVVRLDPRREVQPTSADTLARACVLIEAGPLRIWAGPSGENEWGLRAIADKSPSSIYLVKLDAPIDPAALREQLPPTPLPQLALLRMPAGSTPDILTPYVGAVIWTEARLLDGPDGAVYMITGTSGDHESSARTQVTADAKTGRLTSIQVTRPSLKLVIDISITALPVRADEPSAWIIEPAERRIVDSLSALGKKDEQPDAPAAPTNPK